MNVGIVGASGYTGEELVSLLAAHPGVELAAVASRSLAGQRLGSQFPRLAAMPITHLEFVASDPEELAALTTVDAWFLALPHGVAAEYVRAFQHAGKPVVDLSADYRLNDPAVYEQYYGSAHPDPELLKKTPCVIPELVETASWSEASLIAAPGCYPTSVQIPLVPLLQSGLLSGEGIIINSYSAVSGAGRKLDNRFLFVDRAESLTPYGLVSHRHLPEIEQELSRAAGRPVTVQFTPHLAPIRRGILTTIVCPAPPDLDLEAVYSEWSATYRDRRFINILPTGSQPDTARVAGTNRADIAAAHDPRTGNLILTSAIDNLLKGAGGQAVQIFNLKNGWDETLGLPLS